MSRWIGDLIVVEIVFEVWLIGVWIGQGVMKEALVVLVLLLHFLMAKGSGPYH